MLNRKFVILVFCLLNLDSQCVQASTFQDITKNSWIQDRVKVKYKKEYTFQYSCDGKLLNISVMVEKDISHGTYPASLVISRDGSTLYVANYMNSIAAKIDTKDLTKIGDRFYTHGEYPSGLALSKDEEILYVLNGGHSVENKTIVKFNIQSNKLEEGCFQLPISGIAFLLSEDNLFFYIADFGEGQVYKVEAKTGKILDSLKTGGKPAHMILSPDNKTLFVANCFSPTNTITVIDTQTWKIIGDPIQILDGDPHALAVSPDGSTLVVGCRENDSILLIDTKSIQVIDKIVTNDIASPRSLAISEDGRILFVANKHGDSVTLIDIKTRQVIGRPIATGGHTPLAICLDKNQAEQIRLYVANYGDDTISKITFKISS